MNSNKKPGRGERGGGRCRRTTQLRKDEKKTPKMTEEQLRVQRRGNENDRRKISKEERNYLNPRVLKKRMKILLNPQRSIRHTLKS